MKAKQSFRLALPMVVALVVPVGTHWLLAAEGATAHAKLTPLQNSSVRGTISFAATEGGVQVTGRIEGLPPGSRHGFHIHERGDCSAPDGSSAGGHFNPTVMPHGALDSPQSHIGDLGNVDADSNGVATVSVFKKGATLTEGVTAIVGRSVIVHEKVDDLVSQPAGNAGARVACGVIERGPAA